MKHGKITLGQIEAIINKLGGMAGVQELLAGRLKVSPCEPAFSVWRTVEIGGTDLLTPREFREALERNKFGFDAVLDSAFDKYYPERNITEVDLALITPSDLLFDENSIISCYEILKRAKLYGLDSCPVEVVLRLCLKERRLLSKFRKGLFFGMRPIVHLGTQYIFSITNFGDDISLDGDAGFPEGCYPGITSWIFVLPRK